VRRIEKVEPGYTLTVRLKTNVRTFMIKKYTHLTLEERYQIAAYLKAKFTKQSIADHLNRNISTIKRELINNTGLRGYRPIQAHRLAQSRHRDKPKAIKMTIELCSQLSELFKSNGRQNKYTVE